MKHFIYLVSLILIILLAGCEKEAEILPKNYPYLLLNDVSLIDEQGVTLSGRSFNQNNISVIDYGFLINAVNTTSNYARKISLGYNLESEFEKRVTNDLAQGEEFYVKAYAVTSEYTIYSETKQFKSVGCLPPKINAVSSDSAKSGTLLKIFGSNFSESNNGNSVFFNEVPAIVKESTQDTLTVYCPNTQITKQVEIKISVAEQEDKLNKSFKLITPWKRLDDFPGEPTAFSGQFQNEESGFYFLGGRPEQHENKQLWELNSQTYKWSDYPNFSEGNRKLPFGFTIAGESFMGLGFFVDLNNDFINYRDIWKLDLVNKTWDRVADYPGLINKPAENYPYFILNNELYMLAFYNTDDHELWKYNPISNQWTEMPVPLELWGHYFSDGFTYNNNGYLIEVDGHNYSRYSFSIWKYNTSTNSFSKLDSVLTYYNHIGYGSFKIGDYLYLPGYRKLTQYSLKDGTTFDFDNPNNNFGFSFEFAFNNKAILGIEWSNEVYEFKPE